MDNYEKLLEEKIENAKRDIALLDIIPIKDTKEVSEYVAQCIRLIGEIEAYQDALNEYRQMKAKKEVGWC